MSGPLGFVLPLLGLGTNPLLIRPRRGFFPQPTQQQPSGRPFLPQVTVSEDHTDELQITRHPVARGAPITDHAFKRPKGVVIRFGWSNSPSGPSGFVGSAINAAVSAVGSPVLGAVVGFAESIPSVQSLLSGNAPAQINDIYKQLIALQESLIPFDVYTGKRAYKNMLFASIRVSTDNSTENSLIITAVCEEVIIVETRVINVSINPSAQANPAATTPPVSTGVQSLKDAPSFVPGADTLIGNVTSMAANVGNVQSLFATVAGGVASGSGVLNGALGLLPSALGSASTLLTNTLGNLPLPQEIPLIGGTPQNFAITLGGPISADLKSNLTDMPGVMGSLQTVIAAAQQQLPGVASSLPPSFSGLGAMLATIQAQATGVLAQSSDVLNRNAINTNNSGNQMSLAWNPQSSNWIANIADSTGNPLVNGVPLVTGANLVEQFGHLGFSGQLRTATDNAGDVPPTFNNLGTTGHMYFVGP